MTVRTIGRYHLVAEIGRGAMGVVWAARDPDTGEQVAIKMLHPSLSGAPDARRRLLREMVSARALVHPNSTVMKGLGQTADGVDYLVMERLSGRTLASLLRERGPLPHLVAIRIVAQILDAVAAAHRLGILHRDLKPSNVMLVDGGDGGDDGGDSGNNRYLVKVCDFGLAKLVDPHGMDGDRDGSETVSLDRGSTASTGGDLLCGTPEYMAPEQARGDQLDARADLYAVAVILYQAVVGRVPFVGKSTLAVISQLLTSPPPRPSNLRPDLRIPRALEGLVLRGLAKDRTERPSSADVFRVELLQIARDIERPLRGRRARAAARPVEAVEVARDHEVATLARPVRLAATTAARRQRWAAPLAVFLGLLAVTTTLALTIVRARWGARPALASTAGAGIAAARPVAPPISADRAAAGAASTRAIAGRAMAPVTEQAPPLPSSARRARPRMPRSMRHAPPAARSVAPRGVLYVSAHPPWATIRLDGQVVGSTPKVLEVDPGRHTIEALPLGRGPAQRRTVRVNAASTARVEFAFAE